MSSAKLETECAMAAYRKKIIQRINGIQDLGVLAYLDKFLELFVEKWGGIV